MSRFVMLPNAAVAMLPRTSATLNAVVYTGDFGRDGARTTFASCP
jgi:hypothetical protein